MYFEESFVEEVMYRAIGGVLTRSDAEFMITEHGHDVEDFELELGNDILNARVLLEYLGY